MPSLARLIIVAFLVVAHATTALAAEDCSNGADDDADGAADCMDADCAAVDYDLDGWCDAVDDCVLVADPDQVDADGDGTGDACDVCPLAEGNGLERFPPYQALTGLSALMEEVDSVYAADLDGDGDADVLTAARTAAFLSGEVGWIENLGGGAFGTYRVLATLPLAARSVFATDLDGDGDADVLFGSYGD